MTKKGFKLIPHNGNNYLGFNLLLILLLPKDGLFFKKSGNEKNLVETLGSGYSKIVFVLLNKIVIANIKLISIYV